MTETNGMFGRAPEATDSPRALLVFRVRRLEDVLSDWQQPAYPSQVP
jgi:hypothetical protein